MTTQNAVIETTQPDTEKTQQQETENIRRPTVMKAVLIKRGQYQLPNSLVLPSFDVCLLGEEGTILAPETNVLAILGVGNKDIKCQKCGYTLAMKIRRPQIQNLEIKCPACGSLNQL